MAITRFKNNTYDLSDGQGRPADWQRVQIAALYDIRDELQRLNSLLHCSNFTAIPLKLDRIEKNTRKKRKPRAVGKPALRVVSR